MTSFTSHMHWCRYLSFINLAFFNWILINHKKKIQLWCHCHDFHVYKQKEDWICSLLAYSFCEAKDTQVNKSRWFEPDRTSQHISLSLPFIYLDETMTASFSLHLSPGPCFRNRLDSRKRPGKNMEPAARMLSIISGNVAQRHCLSKGDKYHTF